MKDKSKKIIEKVMAHKHSHLIIFVAGFAVLGTLLILNTQAATGTCSTTGVIGTTTHTISVPETAQYRLWVRMQVPDTTNTNNTNGVRVEIADSQCFTVTTTATNAVNQWQWVNSSATASTTAHITSSLASGSGKSAKIQGLKSGVKVDKVLLLKSDNTCVPSNTVTTTAQPGDNCLIPAPTVNISASPSSVVSGNTSTITWSTVNATACTASGAWTGSKSTGGTQITGILTANSTYTLTCTGVGGSTTQSTIVTVTPAPVSLPNVNLVAGSLKTIPASPVAGEEVTFQVTIRNDGAGATPAGVKHGVSFWIGGNNVAWSDNSTTSLAPGATRVLTSNGGLDGNATWTATQGTSTITAKWDDVFRITESDNIKSELQATVTVAAAPTPPPTPPTDTTKPTATITSPSDFVTSNSSVIIRTVATDDVAISKVELRIVGGAVLGTDTTAPYDLVFDTTKVPNGNYSIVAVAYDTAGNTATSAPITVKVRLADVDRKNGVDIADLSGLISNWNQNNSAVSTNIAYDLNDDGVVGFADLTILISKWTVK
jgi:hypothetical protein